MKRSLFLGSSVDSVLQSKSSVNLPAEGVKNTLVTNVDDTMHEQSIDWDNEAVLCVQVYQSRIGICLLDCQREELSILSQDLSFKGNDPNHENEANLIIENLILQNKPSVVFCSSMIDESIYESLNMLQTECNFEIRMQSHDKFKTQHFCHVWRSFQENNPVIDIEGFQILDELSSNRAMEVTAMALSCLMKSMDSFNSRFSENSATSQFFEKISKVEQLMLKDHMFLDEDSLVALNVFKPLQLPSHLNKNVRVGFSSVFELLGNNCSTLGKDLIKTWLTCPSSNKKVIQQRHKVIRTLIEDKNAILFDDLTNSLRQIPNVFSIVNELNKGIAKLPTWRKLISFCNKALDIIDIVHAIYNVSDDCVLFDTISNDLDKNVLHHILMKTNSIIDLEASLAQEGIVVKENVFKELDEARDIFFELDNVLNVVASEANNALVSGLHGSEKKLFAELNEQNALINAVYLPQLGYLLCVDESVEKMFDSTDLAWSEVFRAQSVIYYKNDETKAMDEHYGDIHAIISDLELEILHELQSTIAAKKYMIFVCGKCFVELEVLASFAQIAIRLNYTEPVIEEKESVIEIKGGRHPLYETLVGTYIPNDFCMHGGPFDHYQWNQIYQRVSVITGANASGKSVFLTQNGLIVFLAHVGCYVPADYARIGLVDKLLTRVVTRESVSKIQSTFQVDAKQMSKCLSLGTNKSLILVDEFGKGTDVIDGPSLFGAIIKEFSVHPSCPRVIACTHYQEVFSPNILTSEIPGVMFYKTEILLQPANRKTAECSVNDDITFLYKLSSGIATNSFGVFCARNCGIKEEIVNRAQELTNLIADGFDVGKSCSNLSTDEMNQFKTNQEIVKEFVAWNLDFESTRSDIAQQTLRRKLTRLLDIGQSFDARI
ncbi:unnamed protein product [Kluyveromyces dobzhanskii CBS 2104]|uniref:WGS project CCBQ000000000 data, contig 00043 n=1 Tax=Kluyveromyces dobzhanskii CBS 2104 TaxID=1427455 RepID=A0A0A8L597_9SACH|nr:unnamed protein product [Kluyveromyces dobzhanskii CBS 2104]